MPSTATGKGEASRKSILRAKGPDGTRRPHPWQGDLSHENLYKSWFQKNTWVHVADVPGVPFSDIGYVYDSGLTWLRFNFLESARLCFN